MTNAQIILGNRIFLMEQGLIKGLEGTSVTYTDEEGNEHTSLMPEEIHTFQEWKKAGRIVRKGQHAVAKFQIWMPKKNKKQDDEEDGKQQDEHKGFYKKVAFFFTIDQTEEAGA